MAKAAKASTIADLDLLFSTGWMPVTKAARHVLEGVGKFGKLGLQSPIASLAKLRLRIISREIDSIVLEILPDEEISIKRPTPENLKRLEGDGAFDFESNVDPPAGRAVFVRRWHVYSWWPRDERQIHEAMPGLLEGKFTLPGGVSSAHDLAVLREAVERTRARNEVAAKRAAYESVIEDLNAAVVEKERSAEVRPETGTAEKPWPKLPARPPPGSGFSADKGWPVVKLVCALEREGHRPLPDLVRKVNDGLALLEPRVEPTNGHLVKKAQFYLRNGGYIERRVAKRGSRKPAQVIAKP